MTSIAAQGRDDPHLTQARGGSRARRRRSRHMPRGWQALPYLAPAIVLLLIFRIVPVGYSMYLSVTQQNDYAPDQFVGLRYYRTMLQDSTLHAGLKNDLLFALSFPIWLLVPAVVAVLIHERIPGWRAFLALYFLPAVLSPVMIGLYYSLILGYNGPVNTLFREIGVPSLARQWLVDPTTAFPVLLGVWIWSITGVGVLFFLNGLAAIDPEIWDAASVDGCGWWSRTRAVTFPLLRPVFEFWSVFVLILIFTSLLPLVISLTGGGPGNATMVADFYVYTTAFQSNRFGYASAIGVTLFMLVLVIVLVQLALLRRGHDRAVR